MAFILKLMGTRWLGFEQESNMIGIMFLEDCSECRVEMEHEWVRLEVRRPVRKWLQKSGQGEMEI